MHKTPSLNRLLKKKHPPRLSKDDAQERIEALQLMLLRIQQALFQSHGRAIILFEGFDASGKGGTIRKLTEALDPRSVRVHPVGPPLAEEQSKHYLYRFWKALPGPGELAVFDRSWYGRVLVERVDGLVPKKRWKQAYEEIAHFERMLTDDGVVLIKIFLGISREAQLERFKERLEDPYKQWKLSEADIEARSKWDEYVRAADDAIEKTHVKQAPWHLIASDDKAFAHVEALALVCEGLKKAGFWLEARPAQAKRLLKELKQLEKLVKNRH